MTAEEFSNEMDTLLNSWSFQLQQGFSYVPVVLDEYEKSVFLTEAQTELVLSIYNGTSGLSFERTEEAAEYLSELVKQVTYGEGTHFEGLDDSSVVYSLPEDLWFITYEKATVEDDSLSCNSSTTREVEVVPVTQDTLYRTKSSPFRGTNERRVLRLLLENLQSELISRYKVVSYTVRYMSKPSPIIVQTLPEGLSIDGQTQEQTCRLKTSLHRRILERACSLALQSKAINQNNKE